SVMRVGETVIARSPDRATWQSRGARKAALCTFLVLACTTAFAAEYPAKPIRWILGFGPGGAPDVLGRLAAQQLTTQIGQPVVLDNRAGANGIIAADLVSKSNPDGYTMLVTSASFAVNPSAHKK